MCLRFNRQTTLKMQYTKPHILKTNKLIFSADIPLNNSVCEAVLISNVRNGRSTAVRNNCVDVGIE